MDHFLPMPTITWFPTPTGKSPSTLCCASLILPSFLSWNMVANMLYLESPAGVGFSYDNNKITFTDNITATDNYDVVTKFFSLYPQYARNKFYISGESVRALLVSLWHPSYSALISMQDTIFLNWFIKFTNTPRPVPTFLPNLTFKDS